MSQVKPCRTQTCDLAKGAAGNVMLMQEETAHEMRASELAVLPSSPVANPPSEDGAYPAGVISPSVAPTNPSPTVTGSVRS
jgi:hypothetical protein